MDLVLLHITERMMSTISQSLGFESEACNCHDMLIAVGIPANPLATVYICVIPTKGWHHPTIDGHTSRGACQS